MTCACEGHKHDYGFARCAHGRCPCMAQEAVAPVKASKKGKPSDPTEGAAS